MESRSKLCDLLHNDFQDVNVVITGGFRAETSLLFVIQIYELLRDAFQDD